MLPAKGRGGGAPGGAGTREWTADGGACRHLARSSRCGGAFLRLFLAQLAGGALGYGGGVPAASGSLGCLGFLSFLLGQGEQIQSSPLVSLNGPD